MKLPLYLVYGRNNTKGKKKILLKGEEESSNQLWIINHKESHHLWVGKRMLGKGPRGPVPTANPSEKWTHWVHQPAWLSRPQSYLASLIMILNQRWKRLKGLNVMITAHDSLHNWQIGPLGISPYCLSLSSTLFR